LDEDLERLAGELEIILEEVDQMIIPVKEKCCQESSHDRAMQVNEIGEVVTDTFAVARIRVFADRLPSQH